MTGLSNSESLESKTTDRRLSALIAWLHDVCPFTIGSIAVASDDASFRRYFRVELAGGGTLIAMDAPPAKEDSARFVKMTSLFARSGAPVPGILAINLSAGFLLINDLGHTDLQAAFAADDHVRLGLYEQALYRLIEFQQTAIESMPAYDELAVRRELSLFPEWYVAKHCQRSWSGVDERAWQAICDTVFERWQDIGRVLVHRDYHSRNLMVRDECALGIIDYQDAVAGPYAYDVVSLLKDAYVDLGEAERERLLDVYYRAATEAGVIAVSRAQFADDVSWCGIQRHLKVMGIFSRLSHRDGKTRYLDDLPLVREYLRDAISKRNELQAILAWLQPPGAA